MAQEDEVSRRLSAAMRAHAAAPLGRGGELRTVSVWVVLVVALGIGLLAGLAAGIVSIV